MNRATDEHSSAITDSPSPQPSAIPSNPFSTRFLWPRKNRFIGASSGEIRRMVDRFFDNKLNGQIIGPHGCGKSTLTFEIEREIEDAFPGRYQFNRKTVGANRRIRSDAVSHAGVRHPAKNRKTILVLDGVERLTWLQRMALIRHCRRNKIGLLVTAHRRIWGIPELTQVEPDLETFLEVADRLQKSAEHKIHHDVLTRIYWSNNSNIRESLMASYDEWESQRCSRA